MIEKIKLIYSKYAPFFQIKKPWDSVIIFVLNILIAIPLFIIIHQNIIEIPSAHYIDRIIIAIILIIVIQLILRAMRKVTLISILIYCIALIWGTLFGKYGFQNVFEDYQSIVYSMNNTPYPQDIIVDKILPFPNKNKVLKAIDYQNPIVRDFAVMSTLKYFKNVREYRDYHTLIQCFAVFKEINSNWNYVSDPKGNEYYATASESAKYLSGDCDDHSILMAACVRAIGGTPRLIHTDGHIYPEILIGNRKDLEAANYLIKKILFPNESKNQPLHYHIDDRGKIWLNLDYTAKYPGGPFMHEEILGVLTLN